LFALNEVFAAAEVSIVMSLRQHKYVILQVLAEFTGGKGQTPTVPGGNLQNAPAVKTDVVETDASFRDCSVFAACNTR